MKSEWENFIRAQRGDGDAWRASLERHQPRLAALALFIVAMLTDVFDGPLARRAPARSPLGNYLDPVADKVLISSVFICLAYDDIVAVWMVVILVAREFVVDGVRAAGAVQGVLVGANWMGKTKTFLQTAAISLALCGSALRWTECPEGYPPPPLAETFLTIAWWMTLLVTILAAAFAVVFVYWNRGLLRRRATI